MVLSFHLAPPSDFSDHWVNHLQGGDPCFWSSRPSLPDCSVWASQARLHIPGSFFLRLLRVEFPDPRIYQATTDFSAALLRPVRLPFGMLPDGSFTARLDSFSVSSDQAIQSAGF